MGNRSKTRVREKIESDDRVSELPDSILHHILSLLPFQSSARISILSRRFRDLWKCYLSHIKVLDFGREFARGQTPEDFVATVNRYIHLHNGHCITKFRLFFDSAHLYSSDAEKWIEFAATNGVIELHLDFCLPNSLYSSSPFKLPYCVFSCDSLVHLNLANCHFNYPSDFNAFYALKTLTLRDVFIADEMLKSLVLNCPLLEELYLRECYSLKCIKVSASMLKILTIVLSCHEWIELFAPNLQSFHYYGNALNDCSFKNISSLVDVILNCKGWHDDYLSILKDLMHVKILTLTSRPLLDIKYVAENGYYTENLPTTFYNLLELQLHSLSLRDDFLFHLYGFLKYCHFPCLERLFIDVRPEFHYHKFQNPPEEPTMCTFSQLRVIQISGFKGCEDEMLLVKFLLKKAIVLETLILVLPPHVYYKKDYYKTDTKITNKDSTSKLAPCQIYHLGFLSEPFASFPKASPDSRIVLCEYSDEKNQLQPTHADVYCRCEPNGY